MSRDLLAYFLIGGMLGILWNRVELGRTPWRRLVPSFGALLIAWPAIAVGMMGIAGLWTRVWRKAHAAEHPQDRAQALPDGFADDPEPHAL